MKLKLVRFGTAAAMAAIAVALAGCGGGSGGGDGQGATPTPTNPAAVRQALDSAAAAGANDTSYNSTAPFSVLQSAGVPAVTINSGAPKVNFAVFSDGKVKSDLALSNVTLGHRQARAGQQRRAGPVGQLHLPQGNPQRRRRPQRQARPGQRAAGGNRPETGRRRPGRGPVGVQPRRLLHVHLPRRHHESELDRHVGIGSVFGQRRCVRAQPHPPRHDRAELRQRRGRNHPRQSVLRLHHRRQRQVGPGRCQPRRARWSTWPSATPATTSFRCTATPTSTRSSA